MKLSILTIRTHRHLHPLLHLLSLSTPHISTDSSKESIFYHHFSFFSVTYNNLPTFSTTIITISSSPHPPKTLVVATAPIDNGHMIDTHRSHHRLPFVHLSPCSFSLSLTHHRIIHNHVVMWWDYLVCKKREAIPHRNSS